MKKILKKLVKRFQDQKGFTLIELMVVIVILGILAAIAVPIYSRQADQARKASAEATMKSIADVLNVYYTQNQAYPTADIPTSGGGTTSTSTSALTYVLSQNGINWTNSGFVDPWKNKYTYATIDDANGVHTGFDLECSGPDGTMGTITNTNGTPSSTDSDDLVICGSTGSLGYITGW